MKIRLYTSLLCLFCIFALEMSIVNAKHGKSQHVVRAIQGPVRKSSCVGREQKISVVMDMDSDDLCRITNNCSCPVYYAPVESKQVQTDIGTINSQEATLVAKFDETTKTKTYVTGSSKELLEVVMKPICYSLFCDFVPYNGTYDDLLAEVYNKTWHSVVGDIEIGPDRYRYPEYTQPYVDSGLEMLVPVQKDTSKDVFSQFVKLSYDPDTKETYVTSFPIEMLDVVMKQLHYSAGGTQRILIDENLGNENKPLKIGVPVEAVFNQFVKVSYDQVKDKSYVSGLSIQVLEAVMKQLPYPLSYVLIPYKGTYDDLVANVYRKNLDVAVGDIEITADRHKYVEFSQPYMESSLVMVVPVKRDTMKDGFIFLYAFTTKMWIILLIMTVGTVVNIRPLVVNLIDNIEI